MRKLLVNTPTGAQEIIKVGDGGGYFDASLVLWDERDNGPLPAITLGAMIRVGDALVFNQTRLDAHNTAIAPTREQLKAIRTVKVAGITVNVNGKIFDGDEISQDRMTRALQTSTISGQTTCIWVLHDNTPTTVTKSELEQALVMSMQAQAAVWVIQ